MQTLPDRAVREQAFHDSRYADDSVRADAGKFYAVTGASRSEYRRLLLAFHH